MQSAAINADGRTDGQTDMTECFNNVRSFRIFEGGVSNRWQRAMMYYPN